MNLKQAEKHIERLKKIFPKSHISTTNEFYNRESDNVGLWTGFLEDGTICEFGQDNCGMGMYVDPKLLKYLCLPPQSNLYFILTPIPYHHGPSIMWFHI